MTKVSVIIPVFNEERYLKQCLNSVCTQTLQEIEILCIDDGSTDGSLHILENFANRDSRIKIFTQCNKYAGNARNLGMQNAKGRYLIFLDADDFFMPNLLEYMYSAAVQNQSDVVICEAQYFDDKTGEIIQRKMPLERELLPSNTDCFNRNQVVNGLFQLTNGWAWDKLFFSEFIQKEKLQFTSSRTANDGFFVYMALSLAERITKVEKILVTQRINNSKSLVNTRLQSWKCGFDMLYDVKSGLMERGLYVQLEKSFLNWALNYIVWSYDSMADWEGKEQIYNYVYESEKRMKILDHPAEYYYFPSEYEIYRQMTQTSFGSQVGKVMMNVENERNLLIDAQKQLRKIVCKKKWLFPFSQIKQQSSIVLYGAGQVGQDYYRQIVDSRYCNIVLWMDRKFEHRMNADIDRICGWIMELEMVDYDMIVLALSREEDVSWAFELLLHQGVESNHIIWKL